ncbi:MAG TPA: glycosyltransferase 87 family protein [Pseudonocardia sp.]|nr:glycosyltransferase 87 family protein [Pseudonocardia sp.]
MTAAATLRGRAGSLGSALREHPARIYLLSLPLLAAAVTVLAISLGGHYLDLEVYRLGVQTWLSGGDLYGALPMTSAGIALPFIYPPFAAMVMVPLTVTGWGFASVAVFLASLLSLGVTMYVVLRRLWPSGGHAGALAATTAVVPVCLGLEPVSQTFGFGQINLILMAMVAVDCLMVRTRLPRGVLIGLAAAIKLTPAAFVLFFLLRKDYRSAVVAAVTGAVATGIGVLIAPAASQRYWGGGMSGVSGVSGSPFFTNQTFQAVFARAGIGGLELKLGWVVLSALLLYLAAPAIRRAPKPLALVATAGVALLVSPTSWSHHWVWIAPALLVAGVSAWRARSALWAVVTVVLAVTFVVAPFQYLPHGNGGELHWSALQQVIGASYVIVTMAVYVLLWLAWRRRPAAHPVSEQTTTSTA